MNFQSDFEFDPKQLADLDRKLDPRLYHEVLDIAGTDAAHVGEAAASDATPVVTGNARRSTVSDVRKADKVVEGRYPYFDWLDKGRDRRGREMRSRPDGYQIRRRAREQVAAAAPELLDRAGREIAERFSK